MARRGLKYDRGTREYFTGCEWNKGSFYMHVLQHFFVRHCQNLRIFSCVNGF
jgi:hypothetical protein